MSSDHDRQEHLAWCKERALAEASTGHLGNAVASMISDLAKHVGTALLLSEATVSFGMDLALCDDAPGVEAWIEAFR